MSRRAVNAIKDQFEFKLPVELLVPSDPDNDDVVSEFRLALIDVCAARNNNAQLTTEAKANQRGFYEEMRKRLPPEIADRVEWKSNDWESDDGKPIKVRDIVALAWIPLTVLNEHGLLPTLTENGTPLNFSVLPQNIYRNKGELSKLFDTLMEHPDVSKAKNGPQHEMHNTAVGSAFDVLAALPSLYDKIFVEMGDAYNHKDGGAGKFGKLRAVRMPKRGKASSPYMHLDGDYGVPHGFVLPILFGLKALMKVENGTVSWSADPGAFLDRHLRSLVGAFRMPMEMASFDPQKVAKSENSYNFMIGEVEKAQIKEHAAA